MSVKVATLEEIPAGSLKVADVHGAPVVVARVGDQVYACSAVCSHQNGPLGDGRLNGARLTCPWHGWMFDMMTGQCLMPARGIGLMTYPVRIEGDEIWVGA